MHQQINMYQPVFRRQAKVFSAITLLQITGVATVLLCGFIMHAHWTVSSLDSTAESLSSQYTRLEARLGILESDGSEARLDVERQIQQLQETLDEREALLESFSRLTFKESSAFSEFFETLATRTLPGLWLTGISLSEDGETELRGSTLNATLVPRYLQGMPEQHRFVALHNGSVNLTRTDPARPDVDFVLRSNSQETL